MSDVFKRPTVFSTQHHKNAFVERHSQPSHKIMNERSMNQLELTRKNPLDEIIESNLEEK